MRLNQFNNQIFLIICSLSSIISFTQTNDFARLQSTYSRLYYDENKIDSALLVSLEMKNWSIANESDTSTRHAISLHYIANCYNVLENSDSAFYYYTACLTEFQNLKKEYDAEYALALSNYGLLNWKKNDFEEAIKAYSKALDIYSKIYESKHVRIANCLLNLGKLNLWIGNYELTEIYLLKSKEIIKSLFGANSTDYADCLVGLSDFHYAIGDFSNALLLSLNAKDIFVQNYGIENLNVAHCFFAMGSINYALNNLKNCESDYIQALGLYEKLFGKLHSTISPCFSGLGLLNWKTKNFKIAESYLLQAIEIEKKSISGVQPTTLMFLGAVYADIKDYSKAEPLYLQALELHKQTVGVAHDQYITTELNYAYLLAEMNREKEAIDILTQSIIKKTKQISDNFEWLSDSQKEVYWKQEIWFFDQLSRFVHIFYEKIDVNQLYYNSVLLTKSKLLETRISADNFERDRDEIKEKLASLRRLIVKMESDGSTEKDKLEILHKEADSLDKRLTLSWPEYAQQKKNLSITWDQVQKNLDKGEAAIEFVRFKNEDDSMVYYNALVLRNDVKQPQLVKLCKEKDLQSIAPKMGYSAYYPLVWKPLDTLLKDIKIIYYAPTGELNNVPFHAIYAPKGKGDEVLAAKTDKRGVIIQIERAATEQNAKYLMDRYTMHQLTSTRYLAMGLKQKAKEPIGNTIAMVGGVNYDYLPGSSAASKKNKKDKNATRSSASASGKLNYLEGTKTEVEQINNNVTTATWQTKLIENNDAIEENITKLEGKEAKGILHLATHGYAFPEYDFKDTTISKNSLRFSYRYSTNPMVRSGLILSGGNWAWTGSDTLSKLGAEQNGILTALEVSQLNLKKTKLVVLSACETGLGKIEGSEGTFGLKRGFKLAGVEQMIVSLWSVPDKETMELMTLFYSDLTKTLNPVTSFSNAQKEMRTKYPSDPEKWAGFVLVR
jgi:CHAT domain-containing protein